ncbi:hydroxymethylbilane synthase [Candidatus Persebacteraceae bacterium Df01]|jgi:hydroxymethylbilane synthase|uniref:Hydroxymethylbilane synthase n=1 Tax=Candidatus Doriopsillibacter californiensis TaxID=2970740 RepID=A0ABT7QKI5_9GAMM|nr:hydroxymethylbilane synthase [Candidatus Persebacteraceae bacterium Df01]
MVIRLAARKSPLAQQQAYTVAAALQAAGIEAEIRTFSTTGDDITDRPLSEVGGKELFVNRLRQALLVDEADAAVHSLKDMAATSDADFFLGAVGFAEDPRDVFVGRHYATLAQMSDGTSVGTCSPRRAALLAKQAPKLRAVMMRGNVQTRLAKLEAGDCDALLLAAAGLHRLNMKEIVGEYLPSEIFIPAPGQGVLAVECLTEHKTLRQQLNIINDKKTAIRIRAERAFAAAIDGDCHTPLGAHAQIMAGKVHLRAFYASDGHYRAAEAQAPLHSPEEAGETAAQIVLHQ